MLRASLTPPDLAFEQTKFSMGTHGYERREKRVATSLTESGLSGPVEAVRTGHDHSGKACQSQSVRQGSSDT
jgi:hypothetical protein